MTTTGDRPIAIEAIDVTKEYGDRVRALDHANLCVPEGEWLAITGPSGSGKSTLLHLFAALDQPTSGRILVAGRDLRHLPNVDRYRREEVGLVFQLHNLLPHLTARQNLEIAMLGTHRARRTRRERAAALLGEVGLAGKAGRKPPELSGGERQRVALARALANDPRLVLADEPTGSLDPASVSQTLDMFRTLREQHGITIIMVTHDADVAAAADRTVTMREGRIDAAPSVRLRSRGRPSP
ncbi:MAG TPA: ABC transporter ATP-binding protein [Acidimicrobiia bacterium]|nr:ABC transporter ATP-binding protein [Acidimicrobiia bacterium]